MKIIQEVKKLYIHIRRILYCHSLSKCELTPKAIAIYNYCDKIINDNFKEEDKIEAYESIIDRITSDNSSRKERATIIQWIYLQTADGKYLS